MKDKTLKHCSCCSALCAQPVRPKSDSALELYLSPHHRMKRSGLTFLEVSTRHCYRCSTWLQDIPIDPGQSNQATSGLGRCNHTQMKSLASNLYDSTELSHLQQRLEMHRIAKRLVRVSCQREKASQIRSQLAFERQNFQYAQGFVYESIQQLIDVLQQGIDSRRLETKYEELVGLFWQCEVDRSTMQAKKVQVDTLQWDSDKIDFQPVNEERKLAFQSLKRTEPGCKIDYTSEGSNSASTQIPCLLKRFYDRKGDVGVQLERLYDLEDSYIEDKERRELLLDRGEPATRPESEFSAQYQAQRQHIFLALDAAQRDASMLEVGCREAGITIDATVTSNGDCSDIVGSQSRYSPSLQGMESRAKPVLATIRGNRLSRWSRGGDDSSASQPRTASGSINKSIETWLADISAESPALQHLGLEALDLATSMVLSDPTANRKASRRLHHRNYSHEGVSRSVELRSIAAKDTSCERIQ